MTRAPFRGVAEIIGFNWPRYLVGIGFVAALVVALQFDVARPVRVGLWVALILTCWWMLASLVASHWVYDRSSLYRFDWLRECFESTPHDWVHLHAGLDQSTGTIESQLGVAPRAVFDFHCSEEFTEPSIERARDLGQSDARTRPVPFDALPLEDSSCDAVFSVFSAHELRNHDARTKLFREMARVLRPTGSIVLVEHLRDLPNFVVYGPGFLHFLGRTTWRATAAASDLTITREVPITPFVRAMLLRRAT